MKITSNKIVLIGSGAVGSSFLFSAINQGVAEEYGIIDINNELALGTKLDLEDSLPSLTNNAKISVGGFEMLEDADILVITAGRPQRPGETRLDMVKDNALIMLGIAKKVKASKFKGITIIAANPVDVMTTVYQEITQFKHTKVISSGCVLDSSRLKIELSKLAKIDARNFHIYVLGEHGDSSVVTLANGTIAGVKIMDEFKRLNISKEELISIHEKVTKKAYDIIEKKGATYYGIGANLAYITKVILRDENRILPIGKFLTGEYGQKGIYASVLSTVGCGGIVTTHEFPLSEKEKQIFINSTNILKETYKSVLPLLK